MGDNALPSYIDSIIEQCPELVYSCGTVERGRTLVQVPLSLSQVLRQVPFLPMDEGEDGAGVGQCFDLGLTSIGRAEDLPMLTLARQQAEQEWLGAIAALAKLLLYANSRPEPYPSDRPMGVALSGPFPVLPDQLLGRTLSHWLLIPEPLEQILAVTRPLLPGQPSPLAGNFRSKVTMVPLTGGDPLARERFCLLLTARFSLILLLGEDGEGQPQFQFSFDPEAIAAVWQQLRGRVLQARPPLVPALDQAAEEFSPVPPDYRLVTHYSHLLLKEIRSLADVTPLAEGPEPIQGLVDPSPRLAVPQERGHRVQRLSGPGKAGHRLKADPPSQSSDRELLKAMAHEIRTPLTTIRTLTRSLLKRKDIGEEIRKRLGSIDRECTQQIDRFNLIFTAVELDSTPTQGRRSPLSPISLQQLFEDSIPLWQQQVSRRNLSLTVNLPTHLPRVTSDPTMLNQVLTGLVDRFTHSLSPYSHIELTVTLAGHQLKLQFQSRPPDQGQTDGTSETVDQFLASPFKTLGELLIFQPETGGLSLNMKATKNLFQALGGKLTVRQRSQTGEVLTVFLPLETQ